MTNHYQDTRTELLTSSSNPEAQRIYACADWAQPRDISFDNLPPALKLPEQYRELFTVSVQLLDLAMELDWENTFTKH